MEIPGMPCIPPVYSAGRGNRILLSPASSSVADSSALKEQAAGKLADHPSSAGPLLRQPIIFQGSNKAIRMLGCTRQLKERNEAAPRHAASVRSVATNRFCLPLLILILGPEREGMHRGSFLIIREMPLNTECRLIDYSRYAANTHSARAPTYAFDFMITVTFTQRHRSFRRHLCQLTRPSLTVTSLGKVSFDRFDGKDETKVR